MSTCGFYVAPGLNARTAAWVLPEAALDQCGFAQVEPSSLPVACFQPSRSTHVGPW